jgi:hypothetical protein
VTGGNPLFISELLALLEAQGRLGEVSAASALPLPEGVREAIAHRLVPLPPTAREVLAVGSVIGLQFHVATLSCAAGVSREELLELLEAAGRHGLLHPVAGSREKYAFSHGLVQATLYEGLSPGQRTALHRAVAEALEARYGPDELDARVTELAHHFLEAAPEAEDDRAISYARRAAERALRQYAYDQAAGLFQRALAILPSNRPDDRIALLQCLGEAQTRAGDTELARATLLEVAEAARRHDDAEGLARAALACGVWGLSFGVDDELVRLVEEAIQRLEGEEPGCLTARLKALLATALYWSGETERRLALCEEALTLARAQEARAGDRESTETVAYVLGRVLLARWGPDSATQHVPTSDELIERARRLEDAELELLARNWRISVFLETGDVAAADQEIARVGQMAAELRQPPRAMAFLSLHHGMRALTCGQFDEAERLMAESAEIGQRVQGSVSELAATAQLLVARLLQGRLAELEAPLRTLSDAHPGMIVLRCALAVVLVQAGREEEARAELERLTSAGLDGLPRDNTHLVMLALLAEAASDLGDETRAAAAYGWLEPYAGRWVVSPGATALWPVDRSLGRLAGAVGEVDRALEHLAEARRQGERLRALPTLTLTALDEAALLAGRAEPGDAERASRLAGEARALAEELGMERAQREAERLETATGATGPAPPPPAHGAPAESATLRREGDVWTLALGNRVVRVKDAKGLRQLALLLAHPGVAFPAVDVVAAGEGRPAARGDAAPAQAAAGELSVRGAGEGDSGELMDAEAKEAYRTRLEDLRADLEEAESFNDPERADRARAEYDFIARELAGAVGLGGRDRKAGSDAERARVNATRAIRGTLRRVEEHDAGLGRLLDRTIRTGTFCEYEPDPDRPVTWTVET